MTVKIRPKIAELGGGGGITSATDSATIDFTITGSDITADVISTYNWKEYCRVQFYPNLYNIYSSITHAGFAGKNPSATTTKWTNNWLFVSALTSSSSYGLNHPRFSTVSHELGGYRCVTVIAHELTWTEQAAFFYGLASTYPTSPANTVSDQLVNMTLTGIGIGAQTGEPNYRLAHSDGGGTVTVVDTGISIEADDLAVLSISADAGGSSIDVSFEVIGRSTYTATVSSNIPASTVMLLPAGGVRAVTGLEAGSSGIMFIDCYIP